MSDESNVVELKHPKRGAKAKETKAIVTREQARAWAKDKKSIETACRGGAEAAWQIGAVLMDVENRGTWVVERNEDGTPKYRKFSQVIEDLTPWKRAFGYSLIALAKSFTVEQTLRIGQSKALRLAAAVQVSAPVEGQDQSDDERAIHADILDLIDHAHELTVAEVETALGKILGKKPSKPRAAKAEPIKHKVGEGTEEAIFALKDGMCIFTFQLQASGNGTLLIGRSEVSDTIDMMVEIHGLTVENAHGATARVSIIAPEPDDGNNEEGSEDEHDHA